MISIVSVERTSRYHLNWEILCIVLYKPPDYSWLYNVFSFRAAELFPCKLFRKSVLNQPVLTENVSE